MGDYDLQIMVGVIFSAVLFGGFMYSYSQAPNVDYSSVGNESQTWDTAQSGTGIGGIFELIEDFEDTELLLISLYVTAMTIIGSVIALRFLRGQ